MKIDVIKIFNNFDKDKNGELDFNEMSKLLLGIAPGLKNDEIKDIYVKFD